VNERQRNWLRDSRATLVSAAEILEHFGLDKSDVVEGVRLITVELFEDARQQEEINLLLEQIPPKEDP